MLLRYLALQLPGWALAALLLLWLGAAYPDTPGWMLCAAWLAWAAKDIALFPLTWRAYAGGAQRGPHDPVGQVAETLRGLAPAGLVRVRGEIWRARVEEDEGAIPAGAAVQVTGREGLVLRVRRIRSVGPGAGPAEELSP